HRLRCSTGRIAPVRQGRPACRPGHRTNSAMMPTSLAALATPVPLDAARTILEQMGVALPGPMSVFSSSSLSPSLVALTPRTAAQVQQFVDVVGTVAYIAGGAF